MRKEVVHWHTPEFRERKGAYGHQLLLTYCGKYLRAAVDRPRKYEDDETRMCKNCLRTKVRV